MFKNKFSKGKKIALFSSLSLFLASVSPFIASCSNSSSLNDIYDQNNQNSTNEIGSIPKDFDIFEKEILTLNKYDVKNNIKFKDYEKESIENGNFIYIHDRGQLVDKNISINIKRNVNDFLVEWNKNNGFQQYISSQPENLINKTPSPSNNLFMKDLNYTIYNFWIENNKFFNIELDKNNNINYNDVDKTISFDYKFYILSKKKNPTIINFLGEEFTLFPNIKTTIQFSANNKKINNIINAISNRFFYSWSIEQLDLNISTPSTYVTNIKNFIPNSKSFSYAFQLEFLNLTSNENHFVESNSKDFMDQLNPNLIKEKIEQEIKFNRINFFKYIGHLSEIFKILSTNPTIDDFLYQVAEPLVNFLKTNQIIDDDVSILVADIFKSLKTRKGILSIFKDNKKNIINILIKLLNLEIEGINEIIDFAIGNIGPNMSQKDIDNLKEVLSSLPDEIKNKGIQVIDILIPQPNTDPFLLDVLEQLLNLFKDDIKNLLKSNLKDPSIVDSVYDSIFKIFNKIIERNEVDGNWKYSNKIYDIFIKDKDVKTSIYNDLKIILKGFGIDVNQMLAADMKISIDSLINDFFVNNDNLSSITFSNIFSELHKLTSYINDSANYRIETYFTKLNNDSEINYNSNENKVEFEYNFKFIFLKPLIINLSSIFNILPNWIKLEINGSPAEINPKVLTRLFPNIIEFSENDTLNMTFKPVDNKIYYSIVNKDNKSYHGFDIMIESSQWFTQETNSKGIISNLLSQFNSKEDFSNDLVKGTVILPLKNIIRADKNSTENFKVAKEYTQKLLSTKLKWNFFISTFDESKEIKNSNYNINSYYSGYTFKWNDIDLNQELFKMYNTDNDPIYLSKKYDEYASNFVYKDASNSFAYDYTYISDKKGTTKNETIKLKEISNFTDDQKNKFSNDLFSFGSSIKNNEPIVSITPILHIKTNKVIADWTIIKKVKLNLYIEILSFQVNILLPYNVLDLTSINRTGENYSLSNYSYSNKFSKTFFAPRFSFKSFIQ